MRRTRDLDPMLLTAVVVCAIGVESTWAIGSFWLLGAHAGLVL